MIHIEDLERLILSQKFSGHRMDAIVAYVREGLKHNGYQEGCNNVNSNLRGAQLRIRDKLWAEADLQELRFIVVRNELMIAFMGTEEELATACRLSRLTE